MERWLLDPAYVRLYRSSEVLEMLRLVATSSGAPTPIPAPAATLTAPVDGFLSADMSPSLTWTNPPGTTQIRLQVAPYNNDGPGINLIRDAQTSYKVNGPEFGVGNYVLLPGMTYI